MDIIIIGLSVLFFLDGDFMVLQRCCTAWRSQVS